MIFGWIVSRSNENLVYLRRLDRQCDDHPLKSEKLFGKQLVRYHSEIINTFPNQNFFPRFSPPRTPGHLKAPKTGFEKMTESVFPVSQKQFFSLGNTGGNFRSSLHSESFFASFIRRKQRVSYFKPVSSNCRTLATQTFISNTRVLRI